MFYSSRPREKCAPCLKWLHKPAGQLHRHKFRAIEWPEKQERLTSLRAGSTRKNTRPPSLVSRQPSDPRLIIAVMIDRAFEWQALWCGAVAGPVFAGVMGGSLRTLGIAQDAGMKMAQAAVLKKCKRQGAFVSTRAIFSQSEAGALLRQLDVLGVQPSGCHRGQPSGTARYLRRLPGRADGWAPLYYRCHCARGRCCALGG